jgi:hypothetical protein
MQMRQVGENTLLTLTCGGIIVTIKLIQKHRILNIKLQGEPYGYKGGIHHCGLRRDFLRLNENVG